MNCCKVLFITVLVLGIVTSGSFTQSLDLPEYTTEQRWERAALHVTLAFVLMLRQDLEAGKTPEEHAESIVEIIGPGWSGVTSPAAMARTMHRNWYIWPGAEFTVEEAEDASVTIRANQPWERVFGEVRNFYGVSLKDHNTMFRVFHELIARQQGMKYRQTEDEDGITIKISVP